MSAEKKMARSKMQSMIWKSKLSMISRTDTVQLSSQVVKAVLQMRMSSPTQIRFVIEAVIYQLQTHGPPIYPRAFSNYLRRVLRRQEILIIMDKVARLAKIKELALAFKQRHPELTGQSVKIVEVGPRDGLQNEKQILSLQDKLTLINKLSKSGLKTVQVGSFVSPKWVPQMANSKELFQQIDKLPGVSYPCLVPNIKGMESALEAGVTEIAIFASATEGFSQKNLNCSIEESLNRFVPVMDLAKQKNIQVRGYVSMVVGCPFDGEVQPAKVRWVVEKLLSMGCYEVSMGDTVGRGTPEKTQKLFDQLKSLPKDKLAAHFHDTFDTAIQNIFVAVAQGCRTVDSSIGGLGGCPYSMKPVGNVCTENVVFALETAGLRTGIDVTQISETGHWICKLLSRPSLSIL